MAFAVAGASFTTTPPRPRIVAPKVIQRKESRVGVKFIVIPPKVDVTLNGNHVLVKGPKGQLERTLTNYVSVEQENNTIRVKRASDARCATAQHGLARTLVNNMVVGVSEGFGKTLLLVGVGYRAAVAGSKLTLSLGFSHPVVFDIPDGIQVEVERNTTIRIRGFDKELVGQFAASIRAKRPPEPYKGKGVRYSDEHVRRKEGKRGK